MKTAKTTYWGTILLLVLLSACGRRTYVGADGGTGDGFIGEASIGDGLLRPCVPDCAKICELQGSCGLITADRVKACTNKCAATRSDPATLCLAQLVCKTQQDCTAAQTCVSNPKVPDLFVTISPSSPAAGQLRHRGKVCNKGTATSAPVSLHFYRNPKARPVVGQQGDRKVAVPALAAGSCKDLAATDKGLPAGTYSVWGQIDAENALVELDEGNNVDGPRPVTVGGPNLPDLAVTSMSTSISGNMVYYAFTVCNQGAVKSPSSSLSLWYDHPTAPTDGTTKADTGLYVNSLKAGACHSLKTSLYFYSGSYHSWAYVDKGDYIKESNEQNNTKQVKFTLVGAKLPDLKVSKLSAYTPPGGETIYLVTVCNTGQAATKGDSQLDLYYNLGAAPPSSVAGNQTTTIPTLTVGGCATRILSAKLKPGTYDSWVRIDRNNAVKEQNGSNNVHGPLAVTVLE